MDGSGNSISWNDWLSGVGDDDPGSSRRPDDTALIFYSSGTTGHPKGIELTGANLGRALATMYHLLDLDTDSVAMCPVPFFHVAGLGLALVTTLGGGALLLETIAGPLELVALMQEYKVTHAVAVPAVISVLTSLPAVREADWVPCSSWSTEPRRCHCPCCKTRPRSSGVVSCRHTDSPSRPAASPC
ncbi:AMP-binding protein [Rhodococcus sp. 3Y1]